MYMYMYTLTAYEGTDFKTSSESTLSECVSCPVVVGVVSVLSGLLLADVLATGLFRPGELTAFLTPV